jgi:Domain of unknown function (DUF4129)
LDDGKIAELATMKKIFTNKTALIIIGLLSILVLTFIAAGMENLEFKPGVPFVSGGEASGGTITVGELKIPLERVFFFFFAFLIALSILALIVMPPRQRRKVLLFMAVLLLGLVLYGFLTDQRRQVEPPKIPAEQPSFGEVPEVMVTPELTGIPAQFIPPAVTPWISYAVALVVTLAGSFVLWFLLIRRRSQALPSLEEIAQSAVDDLQAGRDWGRTVEGTYLRMVDTVSRKRDLKRNAHITPAEFAIILERSGLPVDAVRRLTSLFERVRYGGKRSTQQDIEEAVSCLKEIAAACQEIHL